MNDLPFILLLRPLRGRNFRNPLPHPPETPAGLLNPSTVPVDKHLKNSNIQR